MVGVARRAGEAGAVVPHGPEIGGPNLLAFLAHVQGEDPLLAILMARDVKHVAHDGRTAESFADAGDFPSQRRPIFGPLFEQPLFLAEAIAVRTSPSRPILGRCGVNPTERQSEKNGKT